MCADRPDLLYTRTYSCACPSCREPSTVSIDYVECPAVAAVGRWRQQFIAGKGNEAALRRVQLEDIKDFRLKIKPNKLYAAYASYREELGGRPYWLLRTRDKAKTGQTIKVHCRPVSPALDSQAATATGDHEEGQGILQIQCESDGGRAVRQLATALSSHSHHRPPVHQC